MQERVRVLWEDPAQTYKALTDSESMGYHHNFGGEAPLSGTKSHLLNTENWSEIQGHLFSPNPTLSENKIGKQMLTAPLSTVGP